jgi:hypothetical protein
VLKVTSIATPGPMQRKRSSSCVLAGALQHQHDAWLRGGA